MNWFKKKESPIEPNTDLSIITLGEQYPGDIVLGCDYILPTITMDGVNILISLTQLDEDIENSILDNQFNAYFAPVLGVPLVAFQFDCGINLDWSLNFLKVSEPYRNIWLNSKKTRSMIVLVEAETGIVRGVRYYDLPFMDDIRACCKMQLGSSKEEIDGFINTLKSRMDVSTIIIGAQQSCTIEEALSL